MIPSSRAWATPVRVRIRLFEFRSVSRLVASHPDQRRPRRDDQDARGFVPDDVRLVVVSAQGVGAGRTRGRGVDALQFVLRDHAQVAQLAVPVRHGPDLAGLTALDAEEYGAHPVGGETGLREERVAQPLRRVGGLASSPVRWG